MFQEHFFHTIDDKGRLSIPSRFRETLENDFEPPFTIAPDRDCLVAYPADEWEKIRQGITNVSTRDVNLDKFRRVVFSLAKESPLDKAGRILIPQILREYAGLEKEIVLLGVGDKVEIWAKQRFESMMSSLSDSFGSIFSALAEKGE